MKTSQLRETIRKIVERKLQEQVTISHGENGKIIDATEGKSQPTEATAKYAYIVDNTNPDDPRVQLKGYGNMPLSQLKKKGVDGLREMVKWAEQDRYDSVVGKWNDITKYVVNGCNEVSSQRLQEAIPAPQPAAVQVNTDTQGKPMNPNEQAKIDSLEARKIKVSTDLESIKGDLAKKTKPFTDKINKYEKELGNLNSAIERIKA